MHCPQLVAFAVTVRTKLRLMVSLVKQLAVVIEDLANDEKEMETLFLTHHDHERWSSLPRAGKRLARRLRAEWGDDRPRYADAGSVQELAGTAPVPYQSGNYARAHKRFACVKPWRNDLYQFAWPSTLSEPWAASSYPRKLAEGKTHSRALRALANLWVRMMYRMWQSKACDQAESFAAARLAHARHVA